MDPSHRTGAPPDPAIAAAEHPRRWRHLERLEWIGAGPQCNVFRAYDPGLDREVALKLWRAPTDGSHPVGDRMLAEARALARIQHPNVLVVHGVDHEDGLAGMWTDLLEGETLEARLERRGLFTPHEAAAVGIDLCQALSAVHAVGLMHRDLKTYNVMCDGSGKVVLMNFASVGDLTASGMLRTQTLRGTPMVMPPEQLRGERVGPSSDLYSLGVLLYHLVTGRYPVEGESRQELLRKHRDGMVVPLLDRRPNLPRTFVHVVEKAICPDASRRYRTAGEMEQALASTLIEPERLWDPEPISWRDRIRLVIRYLLRHPEYLLMLTLVILDFVLIVYYLVK